MAFVWNVSVCSAIPVSNPIPREGQAIAAPGLSISRPWTSSQDEWTPDMDSEMHIFLLFQKLDA
jgi:hypothetical protein